MERRATTLARAKSTHSCTTMPGSLVCRPKRPGSNSEVASSPAAGPLGIDEHGSTDFDQRFLATQWVDYHDFLAVALRAMLQQAQADPSVQDRRVTNRRDVPVVICGGGCRALRHEMHTA